jgi:hypothetical protein
VVAIDKQVAPTPRNEAPTAKNTTFIPPPLRLGMTAAEKHKMLVTANNANNHIPAFCSIMLTASPV